MTRVSIIIPSHRADRNLGDSIFSVLNQSESSIECILVDDSNDGSVSEMFRETGKDDSRFKLINSGTSRPNGPSVSRNKGVEIATGEFIIFLDSDDLLCQDSIQKRLLFFEANPSSDFVVFHMQEFRNDSEVCLEKSQVIEIDLGRNFLAEFIALNAPWKVTGPMYKTSFVRSLGGFNESLKVGEDPEFALKAILKARAFAVSNVSDCYYRMSHQESLIKTGQKWNKVLGKKIEAIIELLVGEGEAVSEPALRPSIKKLILQNSLAKIRSGNSSSSTHMAMKLVAMTRLTQRERLVLKLLIWLETLSEKKVKGATRIGSLLRPFYLG